LLLHVIALNQSRVRLCSGAHVVEIVQCAGAIRSWVSGEAKNGAGEKQEVARLCQTTEEMIETFCERKQMRGAVYRREDLAAGARLRVPCIVTEYSATTLIPEDCKARLDSLGNMIIEVGATGQ